MSAGNFAVNAEASDRIGIWESCATPLEGAIVLEYDGTAYEVEFFDANGDTIDVITTPSNILELATHA